MTSVAEGTAKIADVVKAGGGLVKVSLGDLRDSLGYGRLGKHVLTNMETHLTENGLGFFPGDMLNAIVNSEPRQWQEIYVFMDDESPLSNVYRAVSDPETYSLPEALDQLIASIPPKTEPNYAAMSAKDRFALIDKIARAGEKTNNTRTRARKAA